jgi:hypothetical protein
MSDKLKKRIGIKNLENSYQDRQTSAKSRNLIFKFKEFQRVFAGALQFYNQMQTWRISWKHQRPSRDTLKIGHLSN